MQTLWGAVEEKETIKNKRRGIRWRTIVFMKPWLPSGKGNEIVFISLFWGKVT